MGGDPLMAIAILGWPVNVLPPEVAREVIRGGRAVCAEAGIPLAGGHSIDAPEPIFGLAVTGVVSKRHLKRNDTATAGCRLYLTKPLGIGILTTAEKKAKLRAQDQGLARDWMCTLNTPGSRFGKLDGVKAMTDVTGFGLLGHLVELAEGSGLTAHLDYAAVPRLPASSITWPKAASPAARCVTSKATATSSAHSATSRNTCCATRKPAAACWWRSALKVKTRSWQSLPNWACNCRQSASWSNDRATRSR